MKNVRNLVLVALFAAIIAILSQIVIPLPSGIPLTLQTFAVALAAYLLGIRRSLIVLGVYIALGAVGAPVFSALRGGIGVLLGITGGYIWGFIPMTALCGWGSHHKALPAIALGIAGMLVCHITGAAQYAVISEMSIWSSFAVASLPYLLKDAVCVLLAWYASVLIKRRITL